MSRHQAACEPPIVSRTTPPGRGAVASVVVKGTRAKQLVAKFLSEKTAKIVSNLPIGGVCVGRFQVPAHPPETVVIGCPDSNTLEIHCHGGAAAVSRIERALGQAGCRQVAWQSLVRQEAPDPIAASARVLLASARTARTAAVLLDQHSGAMRGAVAALIALLQAGRAESAVAGIEELLGRLPLGLHLVDPWNVVLAGPPNAGKSSLLNCLVGRERAIVHGRPGTTRDAVTEVTALAGWPVELCDTAGLRPIDDPVEAAGVHVANGRLQQADLVVLVFDVSQPWTADQDELLQRFPNALVVHNKCDLPADRRAPRPPGLSTSALHGDGVVNLLDAIRRQLVPVEPEPGAAVPFTVEQGTLLERALRAARTGHNSQAAAALRQLLTSNREVPSR